MSVNTIDTYLNQLKFHLSQLPENEKEQHLEEVRDHLIEVKHELETSQIPDAEQKAVRDFIDVETLAGNITKEHNQKETLHIEGGHFWFQVSLVFLLAPLIKFAFPIYQGFTSANLGISTAALIQFVIGCVMFFKHFQHRLNEERLKALRYFSLAMLTTSSIPLFLFSLSIVQSQVLSFGTIAYTLVLLSIWYFILYCVRSIYQKKRRQFI